MNIQDWSPLGLTGLISLQSKGLSSLLQNQNGSGSWQWILGSVLLERRGLALTDPEGSALQLPNILKQSKKKKKTLSLCWAGRAILDSIGLYPCVVHHRYFLESISRKSTRKMQKSACHIMRSVSTDAIHKIHNLALNSLFSFNYCYNSAVNKGKKHFVKWNEIRTW